MAARRAERETSVTSDIKTPVAGPSSQPTARSDSDYSSEGKHGDSEEQPVSTYALGRGARTESDSSDKGEIRI